MTSSALIVDHVVKSYGGKRVLDGISFTAEPGEFIVLVGPSGCGKSTMLRSVAGLEAVDRGAIRIGARDVTQLPPKDRNIAMVFQDYALYPHKTVYENIAFGLRIRKQAEAEIDRRVREAAEKLSLSKLLDRRPGALSGGQRQRVAIGRAIVRNPEVFLFDEPLSNLDAKLRGSMRVTIAKLHKELRATVVYVTHDQTEAMTLADRIIVLEGGGIRQMGKPLDLYYHPKNTFVAQFIGSPPMNLVEGKLHVGPDRQVEFLSAQGLKFRFPKSYVESRSAEMTHGRPVIWGFRAENLRPTMNEDKATGNSYKAQVIVTEPLGPSTAVICEISGHELHVMMPEPHRPKSGDSIELHHSSKHIYLFDAKTQEAIGPI